MVNTLLRPLRRWPAVEAALARFAEPFTTPPVDDFDRYARASAGIASPPRPVLSTRMSPATFEMRFMTLHAAGRFEEMWDMVADDARRAWGDREAFVRDMPRMDANTELLDMQVLNVTMLDGWTDLVHGRAYSNVAQLVMRYRVRLQRGEWSFDREVHLVSVVGGWRSLCYPARANASEVVGRR